MLQVSKKVTHLTPGHEGNEVQQTHLHLLQWSLRSQGPGLSSCEWHSEHSNRTGPEMSQPQERAEVLLRHLLPEESARSEGPDRCNTAGSRPASSYERLAQAPLELSCDYCFSRHTSQRRSVLLPGCMEKSPETQSAGQNLMRSPPSG